MFACCFRLIFRLFINVLTTNLCARNNPSHIGYSKVSIFVQVVFNISMPHVSEFAIQGADQYVASFGSFQRGVHRKIV